MLVAACGSGPGTSSAPASEAASGAAQSDAPSASASGPAASPTGLRATYVSTGPIGQNPFLELIGQGLTDGGTECGVETKVTESADVPTMEDNLQAALDEGYDLIVVNSFDSVDAVTRLAAEHPDQKWAIVDSTVESPNVRGILFKEHEGAYLLGATFGLLANGETTTASLRPSGSAPSGRSTRPSSGAGTSGFEEGVKTVNPDATLDLGWATGFNDPATSKELALAQNDKGAQYVFAFSAAGNTGIFEAAAERNFLTSGVDTDQRTLDPAHIIESMVKRTDVGVHEAVCDLAAGASRAASRRTASPRTGSDRRSSRWTTSIRPSTIPQEVQDQVRTLRDQIVVRRDHRDRLPCPVRRGGPR